MPDFDPNEFFALYGNLSMSDHPEQLSELYGEAFVAADPERTGAFPNDDESYHLSAEQAESLGLYGSQPKSA